MQTQTQWTPRSVDQLPAVKSFKSLRPLMVASAAGDRWKSRIRLLCVFGHNGIEVLLATDEDRVYGLGDNLMGRLGLGVDGGQYWEPRLNTTLTGQRVVSFYHGFAHCLALTASGHVWSWGENRYGQLGVGTNEDTNRPQLIQELADKRVVAIACGNSHTLVLTSDGQVYGFGRNNTGQLGDQTFIPRLSPTAVRLNGDRIVAISCGKNHSLALTDYGLVYAWGLNACGQLGRTLYDGLPVGRDMPAFETPKLVDGLDRLVISKAICGGDHTLLLTTDGHIYAFGDNQYGQVGNGSQKTQQSPICITNEIRFKDIFAYCGRSHSIGLSVDNRYYIWGFVDKSLLYCKPKLIPEKPEEYTVYDVFAIYSRIEITFETIVFNTKSLSTIDVKREPIDRRLSTREDRTESTASNDPNINRVKSRQSVCRSSDLGISVKTTSGDLNVMSNTTKDLRPLIEFQKHLSIGFDNQSDYDLEFKFTDKSIYCQKSIIKYRNKTFWEICAKKMLPIVGSDKHMITVKSFTYESFRAFFQFLYGLKPDINDNISAEVSHLATIYDESVLKAMCGHALSREIAIDLTNVCHLYEKAINDGSVELEKKCIDFVSTYLIDVCKSDVFHSMPKQLSRRLIQAIGD